VAVGVPRHAVEHPRAAAHAVQLAAAVECPPLGAGHAVGERGSARLRECV
jgi:hypothetical protein